MYRLFYTIACMLSIPKTPIIYCSVRSLTMLNLSPFYVLAYSLHNFEDQPPLDNTIDEL